LFFLLNLFAPLTANGGLFSVSVSRLSRTTRVTIGLPRKDLQKEQHEQTEKVFTKENVIKYQMPKIPAVSFNL
jgi:hypothetical protein